MGSLKKVDPEVYKAIYDETMREEENIELIASENFVSEAVLEAQGSVMTNKYAEGYPSARWYGGCEYVDDAERLAIERAKKIFGAEHVNVQPHSGTQANMAVFLAALDVNDKFLAMNIAAGGHLTHGMKINYSGRYFQPFFYGVSKKDECIDYQEVRRLALEYRPKLILAGASAYSRIIDFGKFRKICDEVGAVLMADIAHIAGLVATGLHPSPVPFAEFVTTTTHKTLRGPRGGMIMCKKEFAKKIDGIVFPGTQGGPLMHVIAAKAVALKEAMNPKFAEYQKQIVKNAAALSGELTKKGYRIISGGTDNHMFLMDVTSKNLSGKDAAEALDKARITVNKNLIPFDSQPAYVTSGLRIGTPAVTTRGMKEKQMAEIAGMIDKVLSNHHDEKTIAQVRKDVKRLVSKFPIYKKLAKKIKKDCP